MDRQRVFDVVASHLLAQGHRAKDPSPPGSCLYRAPNGDRCAIGVLIPDALYTPSLEGNSIEKQIVREAISPHYGAIHAEDMSFLTTLQSIHDSINSCGWRVVLMDFAQRWHLSAAVCEELQCP